MVIDLALDKFSGWTVAEWLESCPNELDNDAIGLWTIIPMGRRGFGLTGIDLIEFTQRALLAVLRQGGRPVHGSWEAPSGWVTAEGYGETPEQIAKAVMDRWLLWGGGDPDVSAPWFATPDIYETSEGWTPEPAPASLDEATSQLHGWTVEQWQHELLSSLQKHPIGLWQIVKDSHYDFRLVDDNLTACIRVEILALLRAGARPIEPALDTPSGWRVVERYGAAPEQIAGAVIAEWVASGGGISSEAKLWFGLANTYDPPDAAGRIPLLRREKVAGTPGVTAPYSGATVGAWLDILPTALDGCAVSLRDIVQVARYDFGLTRHFSPARNDLVAITRAALLALLHSGAQLVQPPRLIALGALPTLDGAMPEAIAEAIIDAWEAWGGGDPSIHAPWFAKPGIDVPV
jgi:hypothetical protein